MRNSQPGQQGVRRGAWLLALGWVAACSSSTPGGPLGTNSGGSVSASGSAGTLGSGGGVATGGSLTSGGVSPLGGSSSGNTGGAGVATGGSNTSGATSTAGGSPSSGGQTGTGGATGGAGAAGAGSGGTPSGGTAAGGAASGGTASGDAGKAGATSGGVSSGGASGGASAYPFILGADISSVQESNMTFRDTDGQTKSIFALLKNHGFNYVRLKTFVDPKAPYGYASTSNGCSGFPEPFGDRDHVIAYGKQVKAEGMGFLLDFHYSDTWADPGNQIIPEAWRNAQNISELAMFVHDYTRDVLTRAVAAGARPDMVQVGNEITPGMLAHIPGPNTDCWGNNPQSARVSGSSSNWANLGTLLKAGIQAVREVDPAIQVMLHIENTDDWAGVKRWVDGVRSQNVSFDILGLSCYTAFQGQPSVWETTFKQLATSYPDLKFAIAEYNPDRTRANLIIKNLPSKRGVGTFFWEPTRSGEWGASMFTFQGSTATAKTEDFAEYDALRSQLGL